MKKKMNKRILAVIMAVTLSGTAAAPAVGAEFTDEAAAEAAVGEALNENAVDEVEAEPVFESGETEVNAAFSDSELPEGVIYNDGMEYQYDADTDSYVLIKGKNAERADVPKEINGKPVTEIKTGAFTDCRNLRFVRVNGPIKVASGAFVNCPKLYEFALDSIAYKYQFAVDSFDSDTKVVVTSCGSIESPELDAAGIFHIDYEGGMNSYWRYENGIGTAYSYVVDYDDRSSFVQLEDYMEAIRRRAFFDCQKIQEVVIKGSSLRSIETKAFADCSNLMKIVIPASVTEISDDAFEGAEQAVIYTVKGSYAETYAKNKNMPVVYVDENGQVLEEAVGKAVLDPSSRLVAEQRIYITLKEKVKNADGYDYAVGTSRNCAETGEFLQVKRNRKETGISIGGLDTFQNYYVTCRAWRILDGKKIYGSWSDVQKIYFSSVKAMQPKAPIIRNVKVRGNKVTVYLSATAYPDGFYCALGTKKSDVRPWNIKYAKKDQKSKVITFTNVKKGTYYIGARSYKKISNGTKKSYGPWSGMKKIRIK